MKDKLHPSLRQPLYPGRLRLVGVQEKRETDKDRWLCVAGLPRFCHFGDTCLISIYAISSTPHKTLRIQILHVVIYSRNRRSFINMNTFKWQYYNFYVGYIVKQGLSINIVEYILYYLLIAYVAVTCWNIVISALYPHCRRNWNPTPCLDQTAQETSSIQKATKRKDDIMESD